VKINKHLMAAALMALISGAACQPEAINTSVGNTSNTAANAANIAPSSNTAAPAAADSPTAAYHAAYTARKNKDIPALKKLMAKDILAFFEMVGEDEKKTVDDMLRDLADRPQADTAQARNEKITGDKATIEYRDENGKWQPMDFVKEDGVWKLTLAVGEPENDKPGNSNK
jgi:hypothetical protein